MASVTSVRPRRRHGGLTLVEVMVAVAILAVVAALAAPNLYEMVIRNRLDTVANEFMTALNTARSEANRRGADVMVVPKPGGKTGWDFTPGWEVFVDSNGDGVRSAGEEIITERGRLSDPLTLFSVRTTDRLLFRPATKIAASAGSVARAFVLCHGTQLATAGKQSRSRGIILLTWSGRAQLAAIDASGKPQNVTKCEPIF